MIIKDDVPNTPTLLGELLVRRGTIERNQLEMALALQRRSTKNLGEILISQGWLCEDRLTLAIRRQRNIRFAVGFVASIGYPTSAIAAPLATPTESSAVSVTRTIGHMAVLSEEEMSSISAGSLPSAFDYSSKGITSHAVTPGDSATINDSHPGDNTLNGAVAYSLDIALKILPLDAKISVYNVVYDTSTPPVSWLPNGAIALPWPLSIGAITINDIRPRGTSGPSMGNIGLLALRFNSHPLILMPH